MIIMDGTCGNSVAHFREEIVICEKCGGEGFLSIHSKKVFRLYLRRVFGGHQDNGIFRDATAFYREWKKTGDVECYDCAGAGKWVKRY